METGFGYNDDDGEAPPGWFASLFAAPAKKKAQSRDHAERRRREEAALTARRVADAEAYIVSAPRVDPLLQQLAVAEQMVYQGCIHDAARHHACVNYAGGGLIKMSLAATTVTIVTLLHSFTIEVPTWTCSLCAQSVEVNPIDVGCFSASAIDGSMWFTRTFLEAAQNSLLVGGLSMKGEPFISTLCLKLTPSPAFSEVFHTNRLALPGSAPFSERQLAFSLNALQKVVHGPYDRLDSARQLCPAYPKSFFSGCPACAEDGFSQFDFVDGKPPIVVHSDACFKIWNYKSNAGTLRGHFRWFRSTVDDLVQKEESGLSPETASAPDGDGDLCERQFEALSERAKPGARIQASCCMGATCCAHGLTGRGSVAFARTGAAPLSHISTRPCR